MLLLREKMNSSASLTESEIRGEKRLTTVPSESSEWLLLNVWHLIWPLPLSLLLPSHNWGYLTITHCHVTVAPLVGDLSIWAGLAAVSLYICWSVILIIFLSPAPKDFLHTVKLREKTDSQFLSAHLSFPAAISTKHSGLRASIEAISHEFRWHWLFLG